MSRSRTILTTMLAAALAALVPPATALAQSVRPDLMNLTIEDLMNIEITSASRKEQRAADVAAAVFVITHDDIRRSGMTTIPDLLRLAPGVEVAQINSNKWAVSVRGFNALVREQAARPRRRPQHLQPDLLGRALGHRGPDARRHRSDRGDSRSRRRHLGRERRERRHQHRHQVRGRHAGRTRPRRRRALRRAGGRPLRRDARRGELPCCIRSGPAGIESLIAPGTRANDASHSVTTGFRADWTAQPGALMLEGDFTAGQARALWPNLDPQTAAREPLADDPVRHAGRPSPWPLDARARRRRVAADTVVRRHRGPAGAGRGLPPTRLRRRHAIPHGSRRASGSGGRRRLPVQRREVRRPRRLFADPGCKTTRRS